MENVYDMARRLVAAGISVIPIRCDAPKHPACTGWQYNRLPTPGELRTWFSGRVVGIAAIGGPVSGGLECIDFDEDGLFEKWAEDVHSELPDMLDQLVCVKTPNGTHVWYRCEDVGSSTILSRRHPTAEDLRTRPDKKWYVLTETRGTGAYALLPGSPPACHEDNKPYTYRHEGIQDIGDVRTISKHEREVLLALARQFNSYIDEPKGSARVPRNKVFEGLSPGDDFDMRGSFDFLEGLGWSLERGTWDNGRLRRPGKSSGISATVGIVRGDKGEPLLHVFSTAANLSTGSYGRFRAFGILKHNLDWGAAATELYNLGFGDRKETRTPSQQVAASPADCSLVTVPLDGIKATPVRYLVPGRIAFGKLHLVAGRGGSGKSSLFRKAVADWTTGRPAFGLDYEPPGPIDVMLLCGEDGLADTIVTGLASEGADLKRVEYIQAVSVKGRNQDFTLSPENIGLIRKKLAEKPTIRVIIIDPIASYVGRLKLDDSRATELRAGILDPLNALTEETGITIVMVAHLNKGAGGEAVDRVAGSAAYRDAVRAAYLVAPSPDDADVRLLTPIKWNLPGFQTTTIPFRQIMPDESTLDEILRLPNFDQLGEGDTSIIRSQIRQLVFDDPVRMDVNKVFGPKASNDPAASGFERCKQWLLAFLKDWAYPSAEITKAAEREGFSFAQIKKAKAALGSKGTGQVVSVKRGASDDSWWSGIGPSNTWTYRPEPGQMPVDRDYIPE